MAEPIHIPPTIFCPKCGRSLEMKPIQEQDAINKFEKAGYIAAGRGTCPCGVVAILAKKPLPDEPTFTLMFDIYTTPILEGNKNA